jgi:protein phosphatase methylesterase 1
VLAGTDRLDKELMIGHMQGKFQLVVVPGVGHMLHEVRLRTLFRYLRRTQSCCHRQDNPTRLAETMVEFWKRNERVMVGVKKVGDV